jgi:hypothetical protein
MPKRLIHHLQQFMGPIDFILLSVLVSFLFAAVFFRERLIVRVFVTLMLLSTISLSLLSLSAFSRRLAASAHERAGKPWSPEFRDGTHTMAAVQKPFYTYILLCSAGLAVLALMPRKRGKTPIEEDRTAHPSNHHHRPSSNQVNEA